MAGRLIVVVALAASASASGRAHAQREPPTDAGVEDAPPSGLVDPFAPAPPTTTEPPPTTTEPPPTTTEPPPTTTEPPPSTTEPTTPAEALPADPTPTPPTTATVTTPPTKPHRDARRVRRARRSWPAYPRALAERPLLLPRGIEAGGDLVTARTRTDRSSVTDLLLRLRARFPAGPLELEVGALFFLGRDQPSFADPDALQSLAAIARYRLSPDQSVALGIEDHPDRKSTITALYQVKRHLGLDVAVEATGFVNLDNYAGVTSPYLGTRSISVGGQVRAIAQVTARTALDTHATWAFEHGFTDHPLGWWTGAAAGVGATVSIRPAIDGVLAIDIIESGALRFDTVTAGVAVRSMP